MIGDRKETFERRMAIADRAAVLLSVATVLVVALVLTGWATQTSLLVSFGLNFSTKPNVAMMLLLCAAAVIAIVHRRMVLVRALSAVVIAYGCVSLIQRIADVDFGIDSALFHDFTVAGTERPPGRPARETALGLLSLGAACFLASFGDRRATAAARVCYIAQAVALLGLTQHLVGPADLLPSHRSHTALPTVVGLGLLSVALQCAVGRYAGQIYSTWSDDSLTLQLRRLLILPAVAIASLIISVAVLYVHIVDPELAVVMARTCVVALTASAVAAWLVATRFGARLGSQLENLTRAAEQVRAGKFDVQVPVTGDDEVAALALGVEDMAHELSRQQHLDALTAAVRRATGQHSDLQKALAAFSDLLQSEIPHRRANFFQVEDEGIRIAAVHGPLAATAPKGTFLHFGAERVDAFRAGVEPQLVSFVEPGTPNLLPDVRSYLIIPVAVEGKVQAAVSFMSDVPGDFTEQHRELAERLIQDVAGTLHHLFLLGLETQAREQLDRVNRLRAEFVAVVAHDLRSPMAVISNMAEMMVREWEVLEDSEKLKYLDRISRRTRNLSRFVEDALNVAKIDSGDLTVERQIVDMGALARRVTEDFAFLWPERQFNLYVNDDKVLALADERRQWRILGNLLTNACNYSPADSDIDVSITPDEQGLVIAVTDYGTGIDPSEQSKIFEKFTRATKDPGADGSLGSGLGLYICRRLVEAQGGVIELDSTPGRGSTFRYTVPAAGDGGAE